MYTILRIIGVLDTNKIDRVKQRYTEKNIGI